MAMTITSAIAMGGMRTTDFWKQVIIPGSSLNSSWTCVRIISPKNIKGLAGGAILGNGRIGLIIDTEGLFELAEER